MGGSHSNLDLSLSHLYCLLQNNRNMLICHTQYPHVVYLEITDGKGLDKSDNHHKCINSY